MVLTAAENGASSADIEHHYDVGTPFFELFLDESLTYSCALWDGDGDTLAEAQRRKLRHHLTALALPPDARLLDIGCGWGAMLQLARSEGWAAEAHGLTLSPDQAKHIGATATDGVTADVGHWRDFAPDKPYAGAVCIEAIEHFAGHTMRRDERTAAYRAFFTKAASWLEPGARLTLQTTTVGHARPDRIALADIRFCLEEVFPGSVLPRPADLVTAAPPAFEIEDLTMERAPYVRTCATWSSRLRARREEADALVGPEIADRYERYLAASQRMFDKGHTSLLRLKLRKPD